MMRIALARLLLQNPDVLLLDEPTNHLDLASVEWLQDFLATYAGAIVLVSHDRDFINAVANRVVELRTGWRPSTWATTPTSSSSARSGRRQLAAAAKNQQRKIAQTEAFIERFRYKATKARQVQSRIKALSKLDRVEAPRRSRRSVKFHFPAPPRSGRTVITLARRPQGLRGARRVRRARLRARTRPEGRAHRSERGRQVDAAQDPGRRPAVRARHARAGPERARGVLRSAPDRGADGGQHGVRGARDRRRPHVDR